MSKGETHWKIANTEDEIRSMAALGSVEWVNISSRWSTRLGFLEATLEIVAGNNRIDGDILEIRNYLCVEPVRYYIRYIEAEYVVRESGTPA